MHSLGFEPNAEYKGRTLPGFQMVRRSARPNPVYDDYLAKVPTDDDVRIQLTRSLEDFLKVAALRGAVYLAEQECPYDEEFDGNDLCATHLVAYLGDEPIGCLRARWFAQFAKLERLAVRRDFRHRRAAVHLMQAGIELCRMKGYRRIYGQAQTKVLGFYEKLGFRPVMNGQPFAFSDFDYTEIVLDAEPHPDAIGLDSGPFVIIRPEGRWHEEGVLERSSLRPTGPKPGAGGR